MTADTYSSTLGYLSMGVGNDNNTWGGNANTSVFQIFEDAIANALTSSVTGGTLDLSGSPPPAAASQVRYAALIFSGVLASAQIVQVPNLTKFWWVQNTTSGAYALTIKTPSGSASTAILQNSGWQLVQCDGANGITVSPFNSKKIQMPDGTVSSPPFSNINEPTSGLYRNGAGDWRMSVLGVDIWKATASGLDVLSGNFLRAGSSLIPIGQTAECDAIEAPNGWAFKYGQALNRTTYALLFEATTKTCTGTTNSSTTISSVSADLRGKGLVGAYIEGTGIPTGTTITAIGASSFTLSQAATSSGSGVSLRLLPYGQGDASTTFNVRDERNLTVFGRGDMGGTDRGLITSAVAGVDPTSLAAAYFGAQTLTILQTDLPNVVPTASGTQQLNSGSTGNQAQVPSAGDTPNTGGGGGGNTYGFAQFRTISNVNFANATISSINGGVTQTLMNKLPPGRPGNKIIFTGVYS